MPLIHVLDEPTINQIAAGEVVERPSAVVKELIENAMDAGATAVTAEIKDGGLSFIRITDNGSGIAKEDIALAFLRHATSKIRTAEDLLSVTSLGFRGEALSSIAAVAQLELITKTPAALNGYRYMIEGGEEKSLEEIGCPGGTTIIVRNLFFNTPARRKFLKSAMTEAGYISDLMERLMISHPEVSFKYILNNQVKLQSSGNNNSKDILYHVYGRDIARELLSVDYNSENFRMTGFLGKPIITRGNRNYENYFINGRTIKSNIITKAIEDAYKPYLMQHKYPFTVLYFEIPPAMIDVNVHPQKREIRLKNGEEVYQSVYQAIRSALAGKELIPRVSLTQQEEDKAAARNEAVNMPEPFEENRRKQLENGQGNINNQKINSDPLQKSDDMNRMNRTSGLGRSFEINYDKQGNAQIINKVAEQDKNYLVNEGTGNLMNGSENGAAIRNDIQNDIKNDIKSDIQNGSNDFHNNIMSTNQLNTSNITDHQTMTDNHPNTQPQTAAPPNTQPQITSAEQINLFNDADSESDSRFLSKKALEEHRIIGQVFSTYWLVEYKNELYIIDQHAAHEKVLYERIMAAAKTKTHASQQLLPPIVLTLTLREQEVLSRHKEVLRSIGYEIESFGGNEVSVRAVPADLYGISEKGLLLEFIDDLSGEVTSSISNSQSILERVASLSCKAAVKANHRFSNEEASTLIKELLTLDNPYNCPHGRPVIISMSQYELERKFKRVL